MYNSITAAAYLVKDPEVKTISSGKKVATLRVGISPANAKTKCFVDVEYWDKTAELVEKYLTKGREFVVQGELCMSSWEKTARILPNILSEEKICSFFLLRSPKRSREMKQRGILIQAVTRFPFNESFTRSTD